MEKGWHGPWIAKFLTGKDWGGSGQGKAGGEQWGVDERRTLKLEGSPHDGSEAAQGALEPSPVRCERAQDGAGSGKEGEWDGRWCRRPVIEHPEDLGGKSSLCWTGSGCPTSAGVGSSGKVGTGQPHSLGSLKGTHE